MAERLEGGESAIEEYEEFEKLFVEAYLDWYKASNELDVSRSGQVSQEEMDALDQGHKEKMEKVRDLVVARAKKVGGRVVNQEIEHAKWKIPSNMVNDNTMWAFNLFLFEAVLDSFKED